VSLTTEQLAEQFDKSVAQITWGITLVLMFRSVGSVVFGIAADRWGRKWPFVVNNILFIVLELGTGFCNTYKQFLACRALFGIAMGGLYGNAAATALEDCPEQARGIISETNSYIERAAARRAKGNVAGTFIAEGKVALRRHWLLLIYLVLLMAGFNFMSHGSQDLYPTMLKNQYNFSANAVTVTQVVANLGAMAGGTTVGYSKQDKVRHGRIPIDIIAASQIFGRRFSIIVTSFIGGVLLYPYSFTSSHSVMAAAFFEQFCVQGAWGVIPIHLMELSPGSFRTFVVGTSYQLGNLASSASSTIESTIGERFPLPPKGKVKRYGYGKVICIFMACVFVYVIILALVGPERLGRKFDVAHDSDMTEAAGRDAVAAAAHERGALGKADRDSCEDEKGNSTRTAVEVHA
ncbi:MAG: hypothetical protein Q9191_006075, partial [Dirinaria sp. TL-2023a]